MILDEIGRGTSTFDGLSIAWAVAEYLHDTPGLRPRTLFATHYHELTELARSRERIRNAHFEVRSHRGEVIFLRRLLAGGANRSYGIQVARLAGLPPRVIERAREILGQLEGEGGDGAARGRLVASAQLGLFGSPGPETAAASAPSPEEREVLASLRELDAERTTPLDALALLHRLAERLRDGKEAPSLRDGNEADRCATGKKRERCATGREREGSAMARCRCGVPAPRGGDRGLRRPRATRGARRAPPQPAAPGDAAGRVGS